jgi:hypothetical protein
MTEFGVRQLGDSLKTRYRVPNYLLSPRRGRQIIARGERSEPLVMEANRRSPGRGERLLYQYLSPLPGLIKMQTPTRGSLRSPLATIFRASGAGHALLPVILSFETASLLPPWDRNSISLHRRERVYAIETV